MKTAAADRSRKMGLLGAPDFAAAAVAPVEAVPPPLQRPTGPSYPGMPSDLNTFIAAIYIH
jgi:hypothetical protein